MRVIVVAVGSAKGAGLGAAISEYEARVSRYFRFETIELRAQRVPTSGDTSQIAERESDALWRAVPKGLDVVALDRRGAGLSSEELASYLQELAVYGKPGVAFLIGGPLGLSKGLRERANRVVSLSSFTLQHEVARLVLAEQLYRAGTIQRGEPYHRIG